MLGVNEHMDLKLFGREIILEEFKPIWTRYLIATDRRTDRQTDRWKQSHNRPRSALASRGKNFNEDRPITIFRALTYWAHRAVILAIAWFSCLYLLFTVRCYTERGYATVCRLSFCLSVTFRYRDHINTSKIISRPNSLRLLLRLHWPQYGRSGATGIPPKVGWNRGGPGAQKNPQYLRNAETVQDRTIAS